MDLDAFVTAHRAEWDRLRYLASRHRGSLTPAEVDEIVALYHRAATHLSQVRSNAPDPALLAWLSRLVLRARAALSPSPGFRLAGVARFFLHSFPLEVYRAAGWWIGVTVAFCTMTGIRMAVVAENPEDFAPPGYIREIVDELFEAYYSTYAPENFALLVWVNNAWIAAVCLAGGVAILPVLLVLWANIDNAGTLGGFMVAYGRGDVFFGLVLIHGLLELTAVFIAAGVGLRIAWAWIAPGPDRTRGQALATAARSGMVVALGLAVVLLISGLVEAFVTPQPWPIPAKLAIGTLLWLAFLAYVVVCGRLAVRARHSADLDPLDRGATAPTV